MQLNAFDVLIGLRLSIVRRAADMLVLHFGDIRAHSSGKGTVGAYALHVQGPWRFDGPTGTITGRDDLWEYAGSGERPPNWSYEDGPSLQDQRLDGFLGPRDESTQSWVNEIDRLVVTSAQQTNRGDVRLELTADTQSYCFPLAANARLGAYLRQPQGSIWCFQAKAKVVRLLVFHGRASLAIGARPHDDGTTSALNCAR
jgi:hypothetical protein